MTTKEIIEKYIEQEIPLDGCCEAAIRNAWQAFLRGQAEQPCQCPAAIMDRNMSLKLTQEEFEKDLLCPENPKMGEFNYAYEPVKDLESNHRVSLLIRF